MAKGFIVSSAIHGALTPIVLGKKGRWTIWDEGNVLLATYLLLHKEIQMLPPPGQYTGAYGLYQEVLKRFPWLDATALPTAKASRSVKNWLRRYPGALSAAWCNAQTDPNLQDYARIQRELFWIDHARSFGGLFNAEYIPYIHPVMGCSEADLQRVHPLTRDSGWVRRHSRGGLTSEDAKIVEHAWLITSLIRGRYYEYLARSAGLHLMSHPYKMYAGVKLASGQTIDVLNSEEYLVKMIIGSALLEKTPERRVRTWVENVEKARKAIALRAVALPGAAMDADAERLAADAAKIIGIQATPTRLHRALDYTASVGLGLLFSIKLSPWGFLLGPGAQQMYRHLRGRSIGEDIAKHVFSNRARFRKLARSIPGRIENMSGSRQQN